MYHKHVLLLWDAYQDDMRPETRNDFLKGFKSYRDSFPAGGIDAAFDKERMAASPDYPKMREMIRLLIECRDALPAISLTSARLRGIDLTLANRIESCLEPWEEKQ